MEIRAILWILIATFWTLAITFSLIREYQTNKEYDWFNLRGRKFAYFSNIMTHISLGFVIWSIELFPLPFYAFLRFMGFGIIFFALSQAFWHLSSKDLTRKLLSEK